MNTQTSMSDIVRHINYMEEAKQDLIVNADAIRMTSNNSIAISKYYDDYELNDVSHHQLAEKLGIPYKYYDKIDTIPGLRQYNVEELLRVDKRRFFLRTYKGENSILRAVLSDRFQPFDNSMVMSAIQPLLINDNFDIKASAITDLRMYLQVMIKDKDVEFDFGDDIVNAGFIITNSEVGAGAINIQKVLWRKICSNGMIGKSLLRKYHVGSRIDNDTFFYEMDTINAEVNMIKLKFRDIVRSLFDIRTWEEDIQKISNSKEIIIKDYKKVEEVTKKFFVQEDAEAITQDFLMGSVSKSLWDFANCVTSRAKEVKSPDTAYRYEQFGFDFINNPQLLIVN